MKMYYQSFSFLSYDLILQNGINGSKNSLDDDKDNEDNCICIALNSFKDALIHITSHYLNR